MRADPLSKATIWLNRPASDRQWRRLGHAVFATLLLLSLVLYRERMLHFDTANYAFNLLAFGDFYTGWYRYITYVYQFIPWLAVQLGLSLKTVLLLQSAVYVLIPWLVYTLIVHGFQASRAGIWLALGSILTLRYKFYAPVGEVVSSLPFLVLPFAWLVRPAEKWAGLPSVLNVVIGLLLALPLLVGHPFIFLSLVICSGFYVVWTRFRPGRTFFWTSAGLVLLLVWWLWPAITQDYGTERVNRLNNLGAWLANPQDFTVTDILRTYWRQHYWPVAILFGGLLIELAARKKWLVMAYALLSTVGMFLLVASLYTHLEAQTMLMIDGYLVHVGLAAALPIAFLWTSQGRRLHVCLAGALAVYSLWGIYSVRTYFQAREALLQELVDTYTTSTQPKALIPFDPELSHARLWHDWALPFETLLLTGLDGPEDVRTLEVFDDRRGDLDGLLADPNLFIKPEWYPQDQLPADALPANYFQLRPGPYRVWE